MKKEIFKRAMLILVASIMALTVLGAFSGCGSREKADVHVFYYTYSDTYISTVRSALDAKLSEAGISYQDHDGNNSQTTQTEQIQTAITKGAKLIVVNIVTTGSDDAAGGIVSLAKEADIPVIFFNRAVGTDGSDVTFLSANSTACFIGTDAPEAGHMQGKMIGEYVLANYDKLDLNGDGKISYAMFKGEEGNVEAIYRTQFGVEDADKILTAAGKSALVYFDASAAQKWQTDLEGAWSAKAAKDYMDTNLVTYNEANGNMIELVICNNDGMAEGAVAALQQAGYNKPGAHTVPVFGVDATDAAKALIKDGAMIGTVKQDNVGMAAAICETVKAIAAGKTPVDALASLNDKRFSIAPDCAAKLYVAYAPYTGE